MIDLTSISCDADTTRCSVSFEGYKREAFLEVGQVSLHKHTNLKYWTLEGLVRDGATDFEHDPAKAFSMALVGVEFEYCQNSFVQFSAFIDASDPEHFRVQEGYDPFKEATPCTECKDDDAHDIVKYIPPVNRELWEQVKGKQVRVTIGPNWKGDQ